MTSIQFSPLFIFSGYGVLRDLHSFPTRRSSDLVFVTITEVVSGRYAPIRRGSVVILESLQVIFWKDRKSTRLNSSHRCTSYAVFCLKKKTTRTRPSLELMHHPTPRPAQSRALLR